MWSSSCEADSPVSLPNSDPNPFFAAKRTKKAKRTKQRRSEEEEAWPRKASGGGGGVMLEGYVAGASDGAEQGPDGREGSVARTKSLTDDDLEDLKGCLDLGFGGFSYDEIPELCNTLPALELCYSMSQRFSDETETSSSPSVANWRISSPGDNPEEVKARLKYWAQAVACTVRLCS
ncbi:uncharacterized protein [Typha latifolia]|uniref:uncharacterized protein n=1 Tax=Typha latifolia TaxID=4733 RepID=UPI003C2B700C